MCDIDKEKDKVKMIETKARQIKEILESDDITYGMAKLIIQSVESELLKSGNTFLGQAKFKNVSPLMFISRH